MERLTPRRAILAAALLLAGYFALAVSASRREGPAFDEVAHLTAGYNAWINRDFRFDPGNGDFAKRWATLPLLLSRPEFPPLADPAWRDAEFFSVGSKLLYGMGNDPGAMLLQCRCMIALLGVALGAFVFAASRRIFGAWGGLLSLGLYVFCPSLLAFGALVTTDLALAGALFASTWLLWRLLHRMTPGILGASLAAFAVLAISKMSAVLIAPIAVVLIVARCGNAEPWIWQGAGKFRAVARGRWALALVLLGLAHALAGWAAIWAAYDFRYLARADAQDVGLILTQPPANATAAPVQPGKVLEFGRKHHLLPEGYLKGLEGLLGISERRPSFLNGRWQNGGQAMFFPYAFWVKTPPALLVLLLLSGAGWWLARRDPGTRRRLYEAIPFLALGAIYAAAAMRQNVNIGHRHILPLYPVLYVLAGAAVLGCTRRRRWMPMAVGLALAGFAGESLAVRPHYLEYFSELTGGPAQGYRHLVDSSLDWGQDLPDLARWLAANNPDRRQPVFLAYFGTGSPAYYGIQSGRLPGFPDWRDREVLACTPGCYVISATMFQNLYTPLFGPWNRHYEEEYQRTLRTLQISEEEAADTERLSAGLVRWPEAFWQEQYGKLEQLRFNRLCGWLRATGRRPDAMAGYSILIWNLSAADLHAALWAPPRELAP